jgi:pimeloyl-ACP methyl ester carboxylesterase
MRRVALALACTLAFVASALAEVQSDSRSAGTVAAPAASGDETATLGGRVVDIWRPAGGGAAPIIIFSHGYLGCGRQSRFLTRALADAGYLVVAPQHADSLCSHHLSRPEVPFRRPKDWSDATYRDRRDDIVAVIAALHQDPAFDGKIDWTKLGLMGHSLGGYTVLGLAGGWPGWRIPQVKAVVALSPWCVPFLVTAGLVTAGLVTAGLGSVSAPVEYQGGTYDGGVTPTVSQRGGCFDATRAPAMFVEFQRAGHLAWTDLVAVDHADMIYYARTFFDVWLRGASPELLKVRRDSVSELRVK